MTAGHIYTVAGNGKEGFSGDGGPATGAMLHRPGGVAVDAAGNLAIADTDNDRVRVVAARTGTFYGMPMTVGDIYTVSQASSPQSVTADRTGNLIVAVYLSNTADNSRVQVVAGSAGTFYGQPMTAGGTYTVAGNGAQGFSGRRDRHRRRALRAVRSRGGRRGQPGHRRHSQQPDTGSWRSTPVPSTDCR